MGKPSRTFFSLAVARLEGGLSPAQVLMVGDDIRDDVLGAQSAGLQGALVRTGKYRPGDEFGMEQKPDYVFENLLEMANFVVKNR